jgi:hypothetical protein
MGKVGMEDLKKLVSVLSFAFKRTVNANRQIANFEADLIPGEADTFEVVCSCINQACVLLGQACSNMKRIELSYKYMNMINGVQEEQPHDYISVSFPAELGDMTEMAENFT